MYPKINNSVWLKGKVEARCMQRDQLWFVKRNWNYSIPRNARSLSSLWWQYLSLCQYLGKSLCYQMISSSLCGALTTKTVLWFQSDIIHRCRLYSDFVSDSGHCSLVTLSHCYGVTVCNTRKGTPLCGLGSHDREIHTTKNKETLGSEKPLYLLLCPLQMKIMSFCMVRCQWKENISFLYSSAWATIKMVMASANYQQRTCDLPWLSNVDIHDQVLLVAFLVGDLQTDSLPDVCHG